MENKQLKPKDFIGKWVTSDSWENDSYCLIKSIDESSIWYSKSFLRTTRDTNDRWIIDNLLDLGIEETLIDSDELIYNQPIQIIPIIKTTDINIPNIILTNNKLTI